MSPVPSLLCSISYLAKDFVVQTGRRDAGYHCRSFGVARQQDFSRWIWTIRETFGACRTIVSVDWISAFLGTIFLRTMVGGTALLGMFYLWIGYYAFAAGLLIPLAAIGIYLVADLEDVSSLDDR